MKILATADLQIHNYSKFNEGGRRLKNCIKALKYIFAIADKAEADYILFAGDLFDMQKTLPIEVINATVRALKELFEKYPQIELLAISGNHDYGNRRTIGGEVITSLEFLDLMFDKFTLLEDGKVLKLQDRTDVGIEDSTVVGVSDYYHAEDFYQMVEQADDADLLMVHCTAMGYDNFPGTIDPNHECFKRFPMVISGDIHNSKWLADNFLMLGATIHRDASDVGDEKGVWLFDTDNIREPEFFSLNSKMPTFIRKEEGDKVLPEEEKDYIIWDPVMKVDQDTKVKKEKFNTSVSELELVKNFYETVEEDGDEQKLNVGLDIVKKVI